MSAEEKDILSREVMIEWAARGKRAPRAMGAWKSLEIGGNSWSDGRTEKARKQLEKEKR